MECYPRGHQSYFNMVAENTELNTSLVVEEVQKYPVIYNKFSKDYKTKFIRMNIWKAMERNSGWTRLKKLCSHVTVFAVNKPCWCIVSILCQAQVIVKTNCGLHHFLHQSNIRSYCPSEYSLLCYQYQYPKRIFNCSPRS